VDTSALAKLYIREDGSDRMVELASSLQPQSLVILAIARIEFRSAVRRRQRAGDIPEDLAGQLVSQLQQDIETTFLVQPVTEAVLEEAIGIIDRNVLRAYDAVQLAGCLTTMAALESRHVRFVCSDRELLEVAQAEGLEVWNPMSGAS